MYDDEEIAVATLHKGVCYQHTLDFVIDRDAEFVNSGASPIYISGYQTVAYPQVHLPTDVGLGCLAQRLDCSSCTDTG